MTVAPSSRHWSENVKSRVLRSALAALAIAALVSACGSGPAAPSGDGAAAPAAGTDAFPVTVTHKLGTTVIPAAPKRVVTVGLRDQDFALALGVKPVGVAEWFEGYPNGLGPWAEAAAGDVKPEIVATPAEPDLEKIAALQPDLILSVYNASDQGVYDKLSKIAPTVTAPAGTEDYALSWQEQLQQTGAALGQTAKAKELTTDLEGKIAAAKAAHPEFAGKTIIYGGLAGEPGAYTSTDQRGRFLESLGFTVPKAIDDLATPERAYFVGISKENYRLFDTDVAVISGPASDPAAAIAGEPLYGDLKNVQEGRAVFLNELQGGWSGALSFNSPLSLPYALDGFVAALAAAADGNPATTVPAEPQLKLTSG
jgi:iron complex transport system substrate-binding protein